MAFEINTVRLPLILHLHASLVDLSEELSDFLGLYGNSFIKLLLGVLVTSLHVLRHFHFSVSLFFKFKLINFS